ncbi:uncharacterized protein LOC135828022 [Sycon ciliatum]|uniref:uncharacterized protein LOC135828022 n=1 Tax=Sycon ciliatum TaxID=27933 RepID=UPI0031F6D4B0
MANMLATSVLLLALATVHLKADSPCLGEFQYCDSSGECVLDPSLCGKCKHGEYLCLDQTTCVHDVEGYMECPHLKGGFFDWTMPMEERVEALAKQATVAEQIGQLTNAAPAIVRLGIPAYNWLNDDEHGVKQKHATSFPNGCALGAMWDKQTMYRVGEAVGQEARALHNGFVHEGNRGEPHDNGVGITMYAPNMNLVRDPRWGRAQEVYSEDPVLSSYLTYAFVHAAQVGNGSSPRYMQAAACCKHYAAYDLETVPVDRYHFSATVDARNMWETYMPVFRACVHFAQGAHVMCSYNAINGVPTCADKGLLSGILRDQWHWPGFVVSDYDAWAQIYETHAYCPNMTCAAAAGLNAGMDQEGGGNRAIAQIQPAIDAGMTTKDAVEAAFKRLFLVRLKLGMHDPPHMVEWNYLRNSSIVENDSHLALARYSAQQAMTLYHNVNGALPLSKSLKKVAVIGPSAVNGPLLLGNYAIVPDRGVPSIVDAMQDALGVNPGKFVAKCGEIEEDVSYCSGPACPATPSASLENCCWQCGMNEGCTHYTFLNYTCAQLSSTAGKHSVPGGKSAPCMSHYEHKVAWAGGCDDVACESTRGFGEAVTVANGSDAIVLVLGLDLVQEREGHDRATIELPGHQNDLFTTLRHAYPHTPLVVVLVHGGTMALGNITTQADAILDAWYPGMEDLPAMGNTNLYPNNGSKGITYRYFTGEVQYPFGYGLSYTTFKYSELSLSKTTVKACDFVSVTVRVTNTGEMDGDEVVQVYVEQPHASVPVPRIRLANFERVGIPKGQSAQVELQISPHFHAIVPDSAKDIYEDSPMVEAGVVTVHVGGGQPAYYPGHLTTTFTVSDTQKLSTC